MKELTQPFLNNIQKKRMIGYPKLEISTMCIQINMYWINILKGKLQEYVLDQYLKGYPISYNLKVFENLY